MTALLMPDPQAVRNAGLAADYSAYRRWWHAVVVKRGMAP